MKKLCHFCKHQKIGLLGENPEVVCELSCREYSSDGFKKKVVICTHDDNPVDLFETAEEGANLEKQAEYLLHMQKLLDHYKKKTDSLQDKLLRLE